MKKNSTRDIVNFLAEAGQLKRVKRSGWWVTGITDPESVADHSFRCAVIGYVLARMEGADAYQVLMMTLFNDIHESRINDLHKIAPRYIDVKSAEARAFREQCGLLPQPMRRECEQLRRTYEEQVSREARVARDADILECILQAKEYSEFGYRQAARFISVGHTFLATKSARRLFRALLKWKPAQWWLHLTRFER